MLVETRKILDEIAAMDESASMVLVGGTAMAYHVNHRVSEDLDFAVLADSIDKRAINRILDNLDKCHALQNAISVGDIEEAENDGVDLESFQQNWLVDSVRLTFFVFGSDPKERRVIFESAKEQLGKTYVIGLHGLFITKCLTLCDRIKSRDLFDLEWFVSRGGYSVEDIFSTIQEYRPHLTYEYIRYRLLDSKIPVTDEGFISIVNGEPMIDAGITVQSLRASLQEKVDAMEVELTRRELAAAEGKRGDGLA